jgi:hypothetical protein
MFNFSFFLFLFLFFLIFILLLFLFHLLFLSIAGPPTAKQLAMAAPQNTPSPSTLRSFSLPLKNESLSLTIIGHYPPSQPPNNNDWRGERCGRWVGLGCGNWSVAANSHWGPRIPGYEYVLFNLLSFMNFWRFQSW